MAEILSNPWLAGIVMLVGGIALVGGGEALVRGASKIALGLRISPLVVGLTVVALCTSAPEMAVSFSSALRGGPGVADVAFGNVVGSNICNILLILGVCALIRPLSSSENIVRRDFPVAVLLSLATFLVPLCCRNDAGNSALPQWYGFILLAAFVGYEVVVVRAARREENAKYAAQAARTAAPTPEMTAALDAGNANLKTAVGAVGWVVALLQIIVGLALLVVGARGFVDGASALARSFGVSELVIGLTLVALGTSLPELTVSAVATYRNQVDVALGNVIGSNVCNLVLVLGGTLALLPRGMAIQPQSLYVDLPVMLGAAIVAAWFCLTGRKLDRWEGALLLAAQFGYAFYLVRFAAA